MSRFRVRVAALVSAALFLVALTASARQPVTPEEADLVGKFQLSDGGYLIVSTDDYGRVNGFFERDGQFGRVSGRTAAGAISATWVQKEGSEACETAVEGSPFWGNLKLSRDADGAVQIAWGACEALPRVD